MKNRPSFPISVLFKEDMETVTFDNEVEAACTLEWFDSEDPEQNAVVKDSEGRRVRLKVEELQIQMFELA